MNNLFQNEYRKRKYKLLPYFYMVDYSHSFVQLSHIFLRMKDYIPLNTTPKTLTQIHIGCYRYTL